jgi:hypothetical protein
MHTALAFIMVRGCDAASPAASPRLLLCCVRPAYPVRLRVLSTFLFHCLPLLLFTLFFFLCTPKSPFDFEGLRAEFENNTQKNKSLPEQVGGGEPSKVLHAKSARLRAEKHTTTSVTLQEEKQRRGTSGTRTRRCTVFLICFLSRSTSFHKASSSQSSFFHTQCQRCPPRLPHVVHPRWCWSLPLSWSVAASSPSLRLLPLTPR